MMETKTKTRKPWHSTGKFIKDYLLGVGEDYPYSIWMELCEWLKQRGEPCPKYHSFRRYWYCLTELNLVEFVREEKWKSPFLRKYYRVVEENIDSEDWGNPQRALDFIKGRVWTDPLTGKKIPITSLGGRRYRTKILGLPPRKRGRPPKKLS